MAKEHDEVSFLGGLGASSSLPPTPLPSPLLSPFDISIRHPLAWECWGVGLGHRGIWKSRSFPSSWVYFYGPNCGTFHGRYSLAGTGGNWGFWPRGEGARDGKSWCNYFCQELEPKQQERVSFKTLWQSNFLICHWVCVKKWLVGLYIYHDYSQICNLHNIYSTLSTMSPYIMCICIMYMHVM